MIISILCRNTIDYENNIHVNSKANKNNEVVRLNATNMNINQKNKKVLECIYH